MHEMTAVEREMARREFAKTSEILKGAGFKSLKEVSLSASETATAMGRGLEKAINPLFVVHLADDIRNQLSHGGVGGMENGVALVKADAMPAEAREAAIIAARTPELELALKATNTQYAIDKDFRNTGQEKIVVTGKDATRLQDMNRGFVHN